MMIYHIIGRVNKSARAFKNVYVCTACETFNFISFHAEAITCLPQCTLNLI